MRACVVASFILLSVTGWSCSSEVDRGNPFDPDAPPDQQAPASLVGVVTLDFHGDVSQVEINLAGQTEHPDADGIYTVENIQPGVQSVLFRLEGFADWRTNLNLIPGVATPLDVEMSIQRGGLEGAVELEFESDHSGVTLELVAGWSTTKDFGDSFRLATVSGFSGEFDFNAVPVGDYVLTATKAHYGGQQLAGLEVLADQTVRVDTIVLPPVTGAVKIYGGPDLDSPDYDNLHYTRTTEVSLEILGFNAVEMKLAQDREALVTAEWVTYETIHPYTLVDADGPRVVYVVLRDQEGVLSETLEGHTVLDTHPPTLREVILGNGSGFTDDTGITVKMVAEDFPRESGILQMRIKKGTPPDDQDVFEPYDPDASVILDDLDGRQEVYAQLRDRAGNLSNILGSEIYLDRLAPQAGPVENGPPVKVGNGTGYVTDLQVPVTFNVVDDTTPEEMLSMVVCQNQGCPGQAFGPYASWTVLSLNSEGQHTLYAIFKDGAGNTYSPDGVTFEIDTSPPASPEVRIEEGEVVAGVDIHVLVNALGADEMRIQEMGGLDTGWVALQSRTPFTLLSAEGPHFVSVEVRDFAGHIRPGSATVVLDQTAPTGSVTIDIQSQHCDATQNPEVCYSNSESMLLHVMASDIQPDESDASASLRMVLSLDATFDEPEQQYSPTALVLLANLASQQEVHVRLIDPAGNFADLMAASRVVLDLTPPTLPAITSNYPSGFTNLTNVEINRLAPASDDNQLDRYEYQIERVSSSWHTDWLPAGLNETTIVPSDPMPDCADASCLNLLKLRAVDMAGNVGDAAVVQLTLDQLPPPHPIASVVPVNDAGDRVASSIINADVATVWVSLDSSDDPNFIQFKISTDGGTQWHETGVGVGGIQIPVMLTQNITNNIWVCGEDLAGNSSCQTVTDDLSKVSFTEDSTPPSAPVLYPTVGEVNADRVTMLISTPSGDDNGLDRYEFSVNAGAFTDLGSGETTFEVDLIQDRENVIQIRAVDVAENRSGTYFSAIVENSTPYVRDELEVTSIWSRAVSNLKIDKINSRGVENTKITATLYGRSGGQEEQGMVVVDLRDSDVTWAHGVMASGMDLKGGRSVMDISMWNLCDNTDFLDPVTDPTTDAMCLCFKGTGPCDGDLAQVASLIGPETASLVLSDISEGRLAYHWIDVQDYIVGAPLEMLWKRPLVEWYADGRMFSYDGHRLAWMNRPQDKCIVRVAEPTGGCDPFDGGCTWTEIFYWESQFLPGEMLLDCGPVAMGGDFVVWGHRAATLAGAMRPEILMADLRENPVLVGLVSKNALHFSREDSEIVFDCRKDPGSQVPICQNLFWVDNTAMTPWIYAFNLGMLDSGDATLLPVSDLIDQGAHEMVRHGIMELKRLSASDGRLVWIDGLTGSQDIFFSDLLECYQGASPGGHDCTPYLRILTSAVNRDDEPSLWDKLVTYYRTVESGLQLRMMDIGSYPWMIPRPGAHAFPVIESQRILTIWGDDSNPNRPYNLAVIDPITNQSTPLWSFETLVMPFAFNWSPTFTSAGFIQLMPDGNVGAIYCDTGMDCENNPVDLGQTELLPFVDGCFVTGMRGDDQHMFWTQVCAADNGALLNCDMDNINGTTKCSEGAYRFLLHLESPIRLCNLSVDTVASGAWALVSLLNADTGDSVVYLVDGDKLEAWVTANGPVTVNNLNFDALTGNEGFELELLSYQGVGRCESFDQYSQLDAENMRAAMIMSNQETARCGNVGLNLPSDNLATPYVNEGCNTPPCCGDMPCECDPADVAWDSWDYVRIVVFDIDVGNLTSEVVTLDGEFSHSDPHHVTIFEDWVVWQARFENQDDLMLANLDTGAKRRFTYHVSDQTRPQLGRFADGLRLIWNDTRLGVIQIFNTLIEGS